MISNCLSSMLVVAATAKASLMLSYFTVGENVSLKSVPGVWLNPFATSLALKRSRLPSGLVL